MDPISIVNWIGAALATVALVLILAKARAIGHGVMIAAMFVALAANLAEADYVWAAFFAGLAVVHAAFLGRVVNQVGGQR